MRIDVIVVAVDKPVSASTFPTSDVSERGLEEIEHGTVLLVVGRHAVILRRSAHVVILRSELLVIRIYVCLVLFHPPMQQIRGRRSPTQVAVAVVVEGLVAVVPSAAFLPGEILFLVWHGWIKVLVSQSEPLSVRKIGLGHQIAFYVFASWKVYAVHAIHPFCLVGKLGIYAAFAHLQSQVERCLFAGFKGVDVRF